ncbi:MAG TPA: Ig-like domain-containing protein, partial [Actinomycetota bacterium]|nr:Ig-like domain-containing protein [Actinomycetota bacterium]
MRRFTIIAVALVALGCLPARVGAAGAPTITTPKNGAMVPGASDVTIGGTGTPNASVSVIDSGTSALMGTAKANASGQWTLVKQLADGEYTVHAIETGSAPSPSVTFDVDAVRPLAPDVDNPSNGQIFGPGQNAVINGSALDDTGVLAVQLEFYLLNNLKKRVNSQCACGGTAATWSYTFNPDLAGY